VTRLLLLAIYLLTSSAIFLALVALVLVALG
jgi:hypothetical protein